MGISSGISWEREVDLFGTNWKIKSGYNLIKWGCNGLEPTHSSYHVTTDKL